MNSLNCSFIKDAKKYFYSNDNDNDNNNNEKENNNNLNNLNNKKNFTLPLTPVIIILKKDFYEIINEFNLNDIFAFNCLFSFYKLQNKDNSKFN
jgi:hypothetical protein